MLLRFDLDKSKIILFSIFALIFLKLFFSFSFHLQTLEFTSYLIDALLISVLFISLLTIKIDRRSIYIIVSATAFLVYVGFTGIKTENSLEAVVYYSRFWLPICLYAILISVLHNHEEYWLERATILMYIIVFLGFIGLFFMPMNFNHYEQKLPTYFSGLHKSSYIFICNLIMAFAVFRFLTPVFKGLTVLTSLFMLYMVFEGWEIRTPMLMLVIFVAYSVHGISDFTTKTLVWFGAITIFVFILFNIDTIDWNRVSSGRLAMWDLKMDMLKIRNIQDLLLGTGYGSDYVEVEGWFGEKDSHNNYIQTTIELGTMGLLILTSTILILFKSQTSVIGKAAVLSYAISGLVSNGLIYRLVPSYVFIVLLISLESMDVIERRKNVL